MSNYHLRDKNLSNKARGLLSTMLSLPENWDYTTRGLAAICKDGVDGITFQLKELEQYGYLVRKRIRDGNGRIVDMEYVIYEKPQPGLPDTEKPDMVIPDMDAPSTDTPAQRNIDKRNTEKSKTDLSNIDSILSDGYRPSVLAALETKRREVEHRDMDLYRGIVMDNIDYDALIESYPYDRERLEEMLEIIVETICTTKEYVRIGGSEYAAEVVRSRLMKLNMHHIEFVISCMKENTTKIPNLEKLVATIRSREISACLVLQAQSQLKALYKDNADTIIGNMDSGMFDNVNQQVGEIATQVGTTPQAWNGSIYGMIRNLSDNVIVPIAGVILAFVMTLLQHNLEHRIVIELSLLGQALHTLCLRERRGSLFAVNGFNQQKLLIFFQIRQLHRRGHADLALIDHRKQLRLKLVKSDIPMNLSGTVRTVLCDQFSGSLSTQLLSKLVRS